MDNFKGKKLLILGGTNQQKKLVRAAQELGVYTIVTDYLTNSPAKSICDKSYDYDIKNIEQIVEMCKEEKVDGVITGYIDPCQLPYFKICERLGVACYGTEEQFSYMTNKREFKKLCLENGIDIIPEFSETDIESQKIEFPVFVKPVDSRGSRGQAICHTYDELLSAVEIAKKEASNGEVIIEKYMGNAPEFQMTYFFLNGMGYLIRTADIYTGKKENHMQRVAICAISPSRFTNSYIENANLRILRMFKKIGIKNGPVFFQGFEDNGKYRLFDPGLRFPGVDYELIYKKVFGVDLAKAMVVFALTGSMPFLEMPKESANLDGKYASLIFPTLKAGKIQEINGIQDILKDESVVAFSLRVENGDEIGWTYNVNQRLAEIDILADSFDLLLKKIDEIQYKITVKNDKMQDMVLERFELNSIGGLYEK